MDFEDARVCEIVNAHAVGEAHALILNGEVVVVVVSAEDCLQAVCETCLEELVLLIATEYAVGSHAVARLVALAHDAVVVGDFV